MPRNIVRGHTFTFFSVYHMEKGRAGNENKDLYIFFLRRHSALQTIFNGAHFKVQHITPLCVRRTASWTTRGICVHTWYKRKHWKKKKRERKRRIIYASYPYPSGLFAYCCIRHFLHILFMTREASIKWLTGAVQQDLVVELLGRKVGMVWYSCLLIAHIGSQEVSVLQHSWPNSKPSPCAETLVDPGWDAPRGQAGSWQLFDTEGILGHYFYRPFSTEALDEGANALIPTVLVCT